MKKAKLKKDIYLANEIIDIARVFFEVDVLKESPLSRYTVPRQLTTKAIYTITNLSKKDIGILFQPNKVFKSRNDGSAVLNNLKRAEKLIKQNHEIEGNYNDFFDKITNELDWELKLESENLTALFIIDVVNSYFSVECRTDNKKREIVVPRQLAMYLIRNRTCLSVVEIGELFPCKSRLGYKDHSTVSAAYKAVLDFLEFDKEIQRHVKDLNEIISDKLCVFTQLSNLKTSIFKKINAMNLEELTLLNENL